MLAALLLNLGGGPPPKPPVIAAPARFGGGPFWRRYGYDDDYDEIREAAEESTVIAELAPLTHAAVESAVRAITLAPDPSQDIATFGEAYARAVRSIRADMDEERIERMWEREVRKRLRQQLKQADEELLIIAIMES